MQTSTASTQDIGIVPGTIVAFETVLNLIINGIDNNAIGYWSTIATELPRLFMPRQVEWLSQEDREFHMECWYGYFAPLIEGGKMTLVEHNDDGSTVATHVLDLDAVRRGLDVMAKTAPKHFADMMSGEDDIWTADVFFQCATIGRIKYG